MSHDAWHSVADHGLDVVQVLGLAWIARRGVVLPPVNRRTADSRRRSPRAPAAAVEDAPEEPSN